MDYYVNRTPDKDGNNEVHELWCPTVQKLENYILLGEYDNCQDAVRAAKIYYPTTADGCKICSEECHTE